MTDREGDRSDSGRGPHPPQPGRGTAASTSSPTPRVAVAILNHNGRELLDLIIPSVLAQTLDGVRLLVVDNGSTDGSATHCRERWPNAEVLELGSEIGVAAALNRGVQACRDSEYIALLNNDVELDRGWLQQLVRVLDEHPGAASATGKTYNFFQRDLLDGTGDIIMPCGAATRRGLGEPDDGRYEQPGPVFSACAGVALYRTSAFADIGGFDEDFFAYQEDVDWGFRAQLRGFTARYEPGAVAWHMSGATTRREWPRFNYLQRRNQVLVVIKCYPLRILVRHLPSILSYQAGWLVDAARKGELSRQLAALSAVVVQLPRTIAKRRRIQATRSVGLAQIEAILTPPPHSRETIAERARRLRRLLGAP